MRSARWVQGAPVMGSAQHDEVFFFGAEEASQHPDAKTRSKKNSVWALGHGRVSVGNHKTLRNYRQEIEEKELQGSGLGCHREEQFEGEGTITSFACPFHPHEISWNNAGGKLPSEFVNITFFFYKLSCQMFWNGGWSGGAAAKPTPKPTFASPCNPRSARSCC